MDGWIGLMDGWRVEVVRDICTEAECKMYVTYTRAKQARESRRLYEEWVRCMEGSLGARGRKYFLIVR